ncbi:unnamed protein product [Umbelopsis ramanniana]
MIDLDLFERNQIDELRRETALMALSKHPNVLRVYGSFVQGSKLYIVTPYLFGGSCLDIMKTAYPEGLDEISIATILKQALEALIYLHKNGHIHRDVKSGNLLMDEDGTVLLADFGVSSSLVETGERGGVRKTFVGTPCWMAPEVMDQAGYDYKADIWSFGITAIELATGHAPFAKYPPIKVLMMTLSNDPPTLIRENTKHKYSKTFKDMIDLCLNKDPAKRPTAEKLLQHIFFKQAKKKDYLAKALLSTLPALELRPHKKIPQKHPTITRTTTWDFDADDIDSSKTEPPDTSQIGTEHEQQDGNNNNAEMKSSETEEKKKHISFGDVVVRNPPQPHMSPNAAAHSPPLSSSPKESSENAPSAQTIPKKSRFIIQETITPRDGCEIPSAHPYSGSPHPLVSPLSDSTMRDDDANSLLLGLGMTSSMTPPPSTAPQDVPVKKGRFSVNSTPRHSISGEPNFTPPNEHLLNKDLSLSRINSQENIDRKSRFEIMHNQLPGSPNLPPIPNPTTPNARYESYPLSREGSLPLSGTPLHREASANARVSRFSVVEREPDNKEERDVNREHSRDQSRENSRERNLANASASDILQLPPHQHTPSTESRKIGRFELTSGGPSSLEVKGADGLLHLYDSTSSHSSFSGSPTTSPSSSVSRGQSSRLLDPHTVSTITNQLELLWKQNELQRHVIQDLMFNIGLANHLQPTRNKNGLEISKERPGSQDVILNMESLNQQMDLYLRENDTLRRDNDTLKREIERLRKTGQPAPPSNNRSVTLPPSQDLATSTPSK